MSGHVQINTDDGRAVTTANPLPIAGVITGAGDASAANQTTTNTEIGATNESSAAADNSTSGLNGLIKRLLARLTVFMAQLPASLGAKAMTASLSVTLASDQSTVGVTPAAGELHLGEVTGQGKGVIVPLTVSNSPAYTAGDSIGGKITIANAVRISGGVSILSSIAILDRANQKSAGTIQIYNADPTNATLTDNAATVNSTDDLKIIANIPVAAADYTTINTKAYATLSGLARIVQAASGTTLYASFTTTSTPTFAAATDVQLIFGRAYVN